MPVFSAFLNLVYCLLVVAVAPLIAYRRIVHGKYREGWSQKLVGNCPRRTSTRPAVWFHAVSVGEVLQLGPVVDGLKAARRELDVIITVTTSTGLGVARQKFPNDHVCYFPLDFSWAVRSALDRLRPAAIVLVELELWPNFIREAGRRNIPLALINGRVSEKSHRGYRRVRPLIKRLLSRFSFIAAQNDLYAGRFADLGAPPDRTIITGSIKFDRVQTNRANSLSVEIARSFGIQPHERVFIAGSTQSPEEEYALAAYFALRRDYPDLRLVIVPRHKERFDEVARLIESCRVPLVRRSRKSPVAAGQALASERPVLLLDTLGELSACWGLAEIAFVGGSLTTRGGQNMIEPAGYGAAVLFGPNTQNFRDVVEVLLTHQAARVVDSAQHLTDTVRELLADPAAAAAQGKIAQRLVLGQQGATARTVDLLLQIVPQTVNVVARPGANAA